MESWSKVREKRSDLYWSPILLLLLVKADGRMRWTGHVECLAAMQTDFASENLTGRDQSEGQGLGERVILKS